MSRAWSKPQVVHGTRSWQHILTDYRTLSRELEVQLREVKLNEWQCRSLIRKLSESVEAVDQILESSLTSASSRLDQCVPVRRELNRIVEGVKELIQKCCTQDWLKAAIKVGESEELFIKYHTELEWYVALLRIACAVENSQERVEQLRSFLWDASVSAMRSTIEEKVRRDREEFIKLLKQKSNGNFGQFLLRRFGTRTQGTSGGRTLVIESQQELHIKRPESSIGEGAFAKVFKNGWMGDTYARKVFKDIGERSFKNETKILADLFHPHIVPMICTFVDPQGNSCMLLELLSEDLQKLIERKSNSAAPGAAPFELSQAVDIMLQSGEGLNFLHQKNVSHRDLKPANILVNSEPLLVKIADFGLAKLKKTSAPQSEQTPNVGTSFWRAPELFREAGSRNADARKADIWSFAMICFQILTGKRPFHDVKQQTTLYEEITRGARPYLPSTLPGGLVQLLQACWHIEPLERPSFSYICQELRVLKGILLIGGDPPQSCSIPSKHPSPLQSREVYRLFLDKPNLSTETRVLVVGKSNAGKTTLLRSVIKTNNCVGVMDLEKSTHPARPLHFYESRGLDHKKQVDVIHNFLKTKNSSWTFESVKRRWHAALRPWCPGDEGPSSSDRIHVVWIVYAISQTPHVEWTQLMETIKKYNLPVQVVVTYYSWQDPNGDKLLNNFLVNRDHLQCLRREQMMAFDLVMSDNGMVDADSLRAEADTYLQNPDDKGIWDASQVSRTMSEVKQAARIISDLRIELGRDGFYISQAFFRDAPKSHSYTHSAIFIFKHLCKLWEVPQDLQTALAKRVVDIECFSDRDSDGKNFKLKPGTFLLFSLKVAAVILYMKIVEYPDGLTPVDVKYEAKINACFMYLDTTLKDSFNLCALEKELSWFKPSWFKSKKLTSNLEKVFEKFLEAVKKDVPVSGRSTMRCSSGSLSPSSADSNFSSGFSIRSFLEKGTLSIGTILVLGAAVLISSVGVILNVQYFRDH